MDKKNNKAGFYVTLFSNASAHVYPGNKISNFRTKLAKPIVLNHQYEVAVIEIQYPRTWLSFPQADSRVEIYNPVKDDALSVTTIELSVGHYTSVEQIIKEFNLKCQQQPGTADIKTQYNTVSNYVGVMGPRGSVLTFRGRLAEILGFKTEEPFVLHYKNTYAPHPADIYGGKYNMFIYADIADYQLVGDAHARLLRAINITDDVRRVAILQFDTPHYTPVSKTLIDDIEIDLKDDQNQHIPFLYGKVFVKLHFRPIRQQF